MSTIITTGSESDRSSQTDITGQTSASQRVTSPVVRDVTETPGGQKATSSEIPVLNFSFDLIVDLSAPCARLTYLG